MKSIIASILVLSCFLFKGFAQEHTQQSNFLDTYVGTWENRTGDDHFKLILKKGSCRLNSNSFDCLIGGYEYRRGGKIVASHLDSIPSVITEDNLTAVKVWAHSLVQSGEPGNALTVSLVFVDDGKEQKYSGENSRISVFANSLIQWDLEEGKQPYASSAGNDKRNPKGFSVPASLLLSKRDEMEYENRPEIDKYVGTWEYKSDNESFTLLIKKGKSNMLYYYGDEAYGGYRLVRGGKVLGNHLGGITDIMTEDVLYTSAEPKLKGIESCKLEEVEGCVLRFSFWDVGYGKSSLRGYLKLLTPTTAYFRVWVPERSAIVEQSAGKPKKQTIPTDIVMEKRE